MWRLHGDATIACHRQTRICFQHGFIRQLCRLQGVGGVVTVLCTTNNTQQGSHTRQWPHASSSAPSKWLLTAALHSDSRAEHGTLLEHHDAVAHALAHHAARNACQTVLQELDQQAGGTCTQAVRLHTLRAGVRCGRARWIEHRFISCLCVCAQSAARVVFALVAHWLVCAGSEKMIMIKPWPCYVMWCSQHRLITPC